MENSFQTSFIPKKPIAPVTTTVAPRTSIFTVITIIILIVVALAAGGLFLYKNYLIREKESLSKSLEIARDSFEKDTIDELELFDKRVSAAKKVLSGHLVLSPMFTLLGDLTIPSIQYVKFEHMTTDRGFSVKMSGVARDYKSIALQAESFNTAKGRYFKNVVFSNLQLFDTKEKKGYVGFDVEFDVDPTLLSYEKNNLIESATLNTQGTSGANTTQNVLTPSPVTQELNLNTQISIPVDTTSSAPTVIQQQSSSLPAPVIKKP